ncbi:MAG: N-acetylgalactosamine 6-sulfate sulfatase [Opitutaceae bacterium BACL24 MAG-120322-bin51]|nr:MAG: N-acetylgalactosamine 6-sulfate sulfatase [Opitutaceae bacterium BACL24 MAG-120322-bin51]
MTNLLRTLLATLMVAGAAYTTQARPAEDRPNIIFILIDDLGKEWVNCYGGENIQTPNIDALARGGMKFNNAYSMPQCSSSRACFMTGQYPFRNGWVNHWDSPRWGGGYLDWNNNPSIARTMKSAGYTTAVAGKWQLNDFRIQPDAMVQHGFDDYCMWTGCEGSKDKGHEKKSTQRYWNPYIHTKSGSKTYKGQFGPDIYNQFVLDFISANKETPFFVYYPMALTHEPFVHTPLELDAKSREERFTAMVRYADYLLGKLVEHLDTVGVRKNTIIIWTTDNGTDGKINNTMNGRLVLGGKMKTTENGVNAPFIVNCPGLVHPAETSDALVDFTDLLPTFADLAGGNPEAGYTYDGFSLKDVFLGKAKESKREWILAMGADPARMTDKGVQNVFYFRDRVVRDARFKLFIDTNRKPEKLIDLSQDPEEANNLMGNPEYADVFQRLTAIIDTLPKADNDRSYEPLALNAWDRKASHEADVHKRGIRVNP